MTGPNFDKVVVEYGFRDTVNGEFWIDVRINGTPYSWIGPFDCEGERQRAHDDLLAMTRSLGAIDVPSLPQ